MTRCLTLFFLVLAFSSLASPPEPSSILMLRLYKAPHFHTAQLSNSLDSSGFKLVVEDEIPSADSLAVMLSGADQFWVISDYLHHLDSAHLEVIQNYHAQGGAVYILADNEPYDADAETIALSLTGATFQGNYVADNLTSSFTDKSALTTNEEVYDGFSVSTVTVPEGGKPELVSSEGHVLVVSYQSSTGRILLDGGFTRLYRHWDKNSAQYFVNAANWLAGK